MRWTQRRELHDPANGHVVDSGPERPAAAGGPNRPTRAFAGPPGRGTRGRMIVMCIGAVLLAATVVGVGALSSTDHVRPDGVAAAESDAQVPPDYLRMRALGGAATVSRAALRRAAAQAAAISSAGGSWEYAGANNIGGRITDVVVDPTQANTIYVSSAGGGVWKSTDAGLTYTRCLAGELSAGDRRARPRLGRNALGGHG